MLVARRSSTTSPNESLNSPDDRRFQPEQQQQQQQQHGAGSNEVHGIFSVVDVTPKNNIEKSLQQQRPYQAPRSDRGTNYSGGGVVCRCSPDGDTVIQATSSITTPSTACQNYERQSEYAVDS